MSYTVEMLYLAGIGILYTGKYLFLLLLQFFIGQILNQVIFSSFFNVFEQKQIIEYWGTFKKEWKRMKV